MLAKNKKLVIIFNNRLPTEKAHGMQIVKMCESFALSRISVELWVPKAVNNIKESIFDYYNISNNFLIKKIRCINLPKKIFSGGNIYRFRYFTFLFGLVFVKKNERIFLTRHPEVVFLISFFGGNVFFENHNWYEGKIKIFLFLIKKASGIIVTSNEIKKEFLKNHFNENMILVAPNGVDLKKFNLDIKMEEARKNLGMSRDKKIILYTGHLYKKKGVYTLVDAVKRLPVEFIVFIVGGNLDDINKLKEYTYNHRIKNVFILGHKKHEEMPIYLKVADFLVIANSAKYKSEERYTSPLKLFEYLAAGKVILASKVISLQEFVSDDEVVFFQPDNAKDLAKKIMEISQDRKKQDNLIKNCREKSQMFTWQKRAESILKFLDI